MRWFMLLLGCLTLCLSLTTGCGPDKSTKQLDPNAEQINEDKEEKEESSEG